MSTPSFGRSFRTDSIRSSRARATDFASLVGSAEQKVAVAITKIRSNPPTIGTPDDLTTAIHLRVLPLISAKSCQLLPSVFASPVWSFLMRSIIRKIPIGMPKKKSSPQKRRRRSIIAFEMIRLDRTAKEPLHEQLYRQIRDELKLGRFSDGSSRLPSSRALATDWKVSRSTVRLAFFKLHAEG